MTPSFVTVVDVAVSTSTHYGICGKHVKQYSTAQHRSMREIRALCSAVKYKGRSTTIDVLFDGEGTFQSRVQ